MVERREFLKTSAGLVVASRLASCRTEPEAPPWSAADFPLPESSRVAVLGAADYGGPLTDLLRRGLELFQLPVIGRHVVLKPNLVEFDRNGAVNTHPLLVGAAVEAFRQLGASQVTVAEGPGNRRDNEYLLEASGLGDILRDTGTRYVDLNTDAVRAVVPRSRYTGLTELYVPETVQGADLLVSMPKLKTHHWAGVTLSLKNLFGIMPGAVYGWPKNLLHFTGIENSILDINAVVTVPRFSIVDGIVGMEGDGPIQGEPKPTGVVVFGSDPVAVDATCARIMGLEPSRIRYLSEAARFLGNLAEERTVQVGENPIRYRQDFHMLDHLRGLKMEAASESFHG